MRCLALWAVVWLGSVAWPASANHECGQASFAAVKYPVDGAPRAVVTGDLNDDGFTDVIVAADLSGIMVWLGTGDGTLGEPAQMQLDDSPRGMTLADVDGDGNLDLLLAVWSNYRVVVLEGIGDGTFVTVSVHVMPERPQWVRAADPALGESAT